MPARQGSGRHQAGPNYGDLSVETRDEFRASLLEDLWRDLRYALRRLGRAPSFTAVAILTLAIGIGMSTAVFSVVKTVLLEPLPYPEADRLIRLVETVPPHETPRGVAEERTVMDAQRVVRWRALTRTLSEIGTYLTTSATIVTADGASRAVVARVSSEILPMLGAQMRLGQPFPENDDSRIVVLSANAHKSYFGGAAAARPNGASLRSGKGRSPDSRNRNHPGGWDEDSLWAHRVTAVLPRAQPRPRIRGVFLERSLGRRGRRCQILT